MSVDNNNYIWAFDYYINVIDVVCINGIHSHSHAHWQKWNQMKENIYEMCNKNKRSTGTCTHIL